MASVQAKQLALSLRHIKTNFIVYLSSGDTRSHPLVSLAWQVASASGDRVYKQKIWSRYFRRLEYSDESETNMSGSRN